MADFFEIDFLDVETKKSGDAICLRYELNGETYIHVIDGGYQTTGEKLVSHIKKYFDDPSYIDHVIATHNDGDHSVGLRSVLNEFNIGTLWMLRPWIYAEELIDRFSRYTNVENLRKALREAYSNLAALEDIANEKGIRIQDPFQGARIGAFTVMAPTRSRFLDLVVDSDKTPDAKAETSLASLGSLLMEKAANVVAFIRAEWGQEAFPASDTSSENEMSVVQFAELCGKKILFTADTGRDGLQEVINYAPYVGLTLPGIDRFQVPHHGGRRNVTSELLDQILGPRLNDQPAEGHFTAVISSAKEDEDHPRKVVVRALIHRGAKVVTTEGRGICSSAGDSPKREGWSSVAPEPYPAEYEE